VSNQTCERRIWGSARGGFGEEEEEEDFCLCAFKLKVINMTCETGLLFPFRVHPPPSNQGQLYMGWFIELSARKQTTTRWRIGAVMVLLQKQEFPFDDSAGRCENPF
jgi:hypothetical protein